MNLHLGNLKYSSFFLFLQSPIPTVEWRPLCTRLLFLKKETPLIEIMGFMTVLSVGNAYSTS